MAFKTKDYKVNFVEGQDNYVFSAKKKNAIYLKGLTKADIDTSSFKIINDNLLFSTMDGKNYTVSNYLGIKYIKTDILGSTKTELFNIISENLVDNSANIISNYNKKKLTVSGTNYNDKIDASLSGYAPKGKSNIKKNKGLTINGGNGNDNITGTDYNDVIKGGNGFDTITGSLGADKITGGVGITVVDYTKGDGNDTIYLTKGENFTLNIEGVSDIDDLKFVYANKNKDLRIYTDKNSIEEFITIKNFAKKNVVGSGKVELNLNGKIYDLRTSKDITDPENPEDITLYRTEVTNKNFTGTYLSDEINASNAVLYKKVKQGKKKVTVEKTITDSGLTIKGGAGNDSITGTKYSDKIYGNTGNDTINAGTGNNYIYFNKGDGHDIIENGDGIDSLVFTKKANLTYEYDKYDLIIKYSANDTVTLKDYLKGHSVKYVQIGTKKTVFNPPRPQVNRYQGNDYVIFDGTVIADTITGTDYNDIINAYRGDDIIDGRSGNNRYIFNTGDGNDTIINGEGEDTIQFTSAQTLTYSKNLNSNDLIIGYGNNDTVTLKDYFLNNSHSAKTILNGSQELNITDATASNLQIIIPDDVTDITGTQNDDTFHLKDINSTITVSEGDGNDIIYSGTAEDTLVINNKTFDDLSYEKINNDLIIHYSDNDSVTLKDYFITEHSVENITAENETEVLSEKILLYFNGTNDNDTITGTDYNDIINAYRGDDIIDGRSGNNRYIFNTGDGNDTIINGEGEDTIQFTSAQTLTYLKNDANKNLVISYGDNDTITLQDYFVDNSHSTKTILNGADELNIETELTKGMIITGRQVQGTNGNDIIYSSWNATIHGNSGDDIIYGNCKDYLYGDDGDDYIVSTQCKALEILGESAPNPDEYLNNGFVRIYGGDGNDTIVNYRTNQQQNEYSIIYGDNGDDNITTIGGTVYGGDGNDIIISSKSTAIVDGKEIVLSAGEATIYGGDGNDTIYANYSASNIDGQEGSDEIHVPLDLNGCRVTDSGSTAEDSDVLILDDWSHTNKTIIFNVDRNGNVVGGPSNIFGEFGNYFLSIMDLSQASKVFSVIFGLKYNELYNNSQKVCTVTGSYDCFEKIIDCDGYYITKAQIDVVAQTMAAWMNDNITNANYSTIMGGVDIFTSKYSEVLSIYKQLEWQAPET